MRRSSCSRRQGTKGQRDRGQGTRETGGKTDIQGVRTDIQGVRTDTQGPYRARKTKSINPRTRQRWRYGLREAGIYP